MKDILVIGGVIAAIYYLISQRPTTPQMALLQAAAGPVALPQGVAIGEPNPSASPPNTALTGGGGGGGGYDAGGGYQNLYPGATFNGAQSANDFANWVGSIPIGYPQAPPGVVYVPGTEPGSGGGSGTHGEDDHTRDYPSGIEDWGLLLES